MPISVEQDGTRCLIRLDGGTAGMAETGELRTALLQGLVLGKELHLDLRAIEEIGVALIQVLLAAQQHAVQVGAPFSIRTSAEVDLALRGAGFGPQNLPAAWSGR